MGFEFISVGESSGTRRDIQGGHAGANFSLFIHTKQPSPRHDEIHYSHLAAGMADIADSPRDRAARGDKKGEADKY